MSSNLETAKSDQETASSLGARTAALARVAGRISAQLDLQTVLQTICNEASHLLDLPASSLMLYDDERDVLYTAAGTGPEIDEHIEQSTVIPRALYDGFFNPASSNGSIMVIPDLIALPNLQQANINIRQETRTVVSIKLEGKNQLIGVLSMISLGETRLLTEDDLTLLQALANQASIAIVNARLFEQVSSQSEHLQAVSRRLIDVQEDELRHLARELHDEIGQSLTHLFLILSMANESISKDSIDVSDLQSKLEQAQNLVHHVFNQVRQISLDLRPALLDDLGLLPALVTHFNQYTEQTNIEVNFQHTNVNRRFPSQVETTAYRIIQEALTNAARHAHVQEVEVRLWASEERLGLQVEDQGQGFDPRDVQRNRQTGGLSGMIERAALCGGMLEIESEPGGGTVITTELTIDCTRGDTR